MIPGDLSIDEQETFDERAGILECDGEYSREEAERLAMNEILNDRARERVFNSGGRD